ncbi:MAG: NRDE family protein [Chitinophagales bacterium]|nr:NRDE family protein [Chitinophagales bacterium]
MCTVSYIPIPKNNFILTSNRDETIRRGRATPPGEFSYQEAKVICPIDPLSGGTWIAASANGTISCLLNGAFNKHERRPLYRKSRGIVVLDSLQYESAQEFAALYDFSNIEPFTLVMIVNGKGRELNELRWDGSKLHLNFFDPHDFRIWSSVTLYSKEVIAFKEEIFQNALQHTDYLTPQILMNIHERDFLYEECIEPAQQVHEIKTLSITSVECESNSIVMHYRDLTRKELPDAELKFDLKKH